MALDRYFDNAATTPLDPRVLEEMLPFLKEDFGNANSIHAFGARAMAAVDQARERVAELMGAEDPSQIYFTSGATESNNWVLNAFTDGAVSPFEHSAVREPALHRGFDILANQGPRIAMPDRRYDLISVMSVNNETGDRWNAAEFVPYANYVHSDMTQQAGKLPIDLTGIDYASISGHKLYGPKGIGALYAKEHPPETLLRGGEQEGGHRGGTLNVPGIVGLGAAAKIALEEMERNLAHAQALRDVVLRDLVGVDEWQVNGNVAAGSEISGREGSQASPFILSLSFRGLEGESLVIDLDRSGFAVSAGAACSARSTEPSHVLQALGLSSDWLRGTVRISIGKFNSLDSTAIFATNLRQSVQKLRTMS